MSEEPKRPSVGDLCSKGCGRPTYIKWGIGQICEEGWRRGGVAHCRGMCRYECSSCGHIWSRPEIVRGAHECPKCRRFDTHRCLGRAPESEQVYE